MATFQSRIEDYVGTQTDTIALTQWLTDSARKLVDLMPDNKASVYTSQVAVSSGLAVYSYRVILVSAGSYGARQVEPFYEAQVQLSGSLHQATVRDPVYIINKQYLKVYPASVTGYAMAIAYPTVGYSDSTISVLPQQLIDAMIFDVASRCRVQQANDVINTALSAGIVIITTDLDTDEDIELATAQNVKLNAYQLQYNSYMADAKNLQGKYEDVIKLYLQS